MNIWITGKDLMKQHQLKKNTFIVALIWKTLQMLTIAMQKEYDLYVQKDTLLLADIFENFRNKCLEIYELDPAAFYLHQDQHGKHVLKKKQE